MRIITDDQYAPVAKNYNGCHYCHIGLGTFEWYDKRYEKWETVEGEPMMRLRGNKVCPECYEKYKTGGLKKKAVVVEE